MGHHVEFVKEQVEPGVLVDFLKAFLAGVESGEEFVLQIGDLACSFPGDVLPRSQIDLEYEHDVDKTELEITVEWRHEPVAVGEESTVAGEESAPVGEEPVVDEATPVSDGIRLDADTTSAGHQPG